MISATDEPSENTRTDELADNEAHIGPAGHVNSEFDWKDL